MRLLAEMSLVTGDAATTTKAVSAAIAKDSADVDAVVLRGRQLLSVRDPAAARREFERALALNADLAPIHYQLAVANLQLANGSTSKPAVEAALKSASAHLQTAIQAAREYPEALFQAATLKSQTGSAKSAIAEMGRYVDAHPRSTPARMILGGTLLAAGRDAEAAEAFENIIRVDSAAAEPHFWLASLLMRQGKVVEAKREFETVLRLSPGFSEAANQLVSMELNEGRTDQAVARLVKQLEIVPQSAPLHDLLGIAYLTRKQLDLAEAEFLMAVKLDSNLADAHIRLSEIYNNGGKFDKSIPHAEAAVRSDPRNTRALIALGTALQESGDVAGARRAYEQALALDPRLLGAANNLAVLLSGQPGGLDSAFKLATLAKDIAPSDPHVSDTLGWILFQRGALDQAARLLKFSATGAPDSPSIQYHLGMVAQRLGDTAVARQALTKAANASANFAGKEEARKALAQLK
jgi:Flp pilus assembly protein TadD